MMEINVNQVDDVKVATIVGDIDGSTAPIAQAQILEMAKPGDKIVLDMTGVEYMSSAGLRMLLVMYRTIAGRGDQVVLVGLSEELQDTMEMTGFLDFFEHYDDLDAGLAALA